MSEPVLLDEPTPPQPKRGRRRLLGLVVAALLLVGIIVGGLFILIDPSEQELREAIAEADRLDPGWRWEELEARRKAIPNEENAALHVLAARALLPPVGQGPFFNRVGEAIAYLPPPVQLHEALAHEIQSSLADVEPALVEARKLKGLSEGHFPAGWGESVIGTQRDSDLFNDLVQLLIPEAMILAHTGRAGEALATVRAVLIVGRSAGDQPGLAPFGSRLESQRSAVLSIERTLAQGTPPPDELWATQELLTDEAARPLLLNALRGARAAYQRDFEASPVPPLRPGIGVLRGLVDRPGAARHARSTQAQVLHNATRLVETAKLPVEEQIQRFSDMRAAGPNGSDSPVGYCVRILSSSGEDYCRLQAMLRSAIAGLALERYRGDKGHWPDRLDEVVPAYLKAVPLDPFDAQPLRYQRLADGVVVYSVTPEGDPRRFGRMSWPQGRGARGVDVGFRLWDVDRRRQQPAEVLPLPKLLAAGAAAGNRTLPEP